MNDFDKALEVAAKEDTLKTFGNAFHPVDMKIKELNRMAFIAGGAWSRQFTVQEVNKFIIENWSRVDDSLNLLDVGLFTAKLTLAIESHFKDRGEKV